jgi:hypothetical protein
LKRSRPVHFFALIVSLFKQQSIVNSLLDGHPWTVYSFFLQHYPEIDGATVLDSLKRGERERVLRAAKNACYGSFV